jgi:hypothetical protein
MKQFSIENILINSFRVLREQPKLREPKHFKEFAGIILNFYYAETNFHRGICTSDFQFQNVNDIITVKMADKKYYYFDETVVPLKEALDKLTISDFYSLYLRSSFEDNGNIRNKEPLNITSVSTFLENYK